MGSVLIMGRIEYELLIEREPDLKLPSWHSLHHSFIERIEHMTPTQLAGARRAAMLRKALIGQPVFDIWDRSLDRNTESVCRPETNP